MWNKLNTWLGRSPKDGVQEDFGAIAHAPPDWPAVKDSYGSVQTSAPVAGISNETQMVKLSDPQAVQLLGSAPAASGYAVTELSAMRVSTVYACVRLIVGTIGGMPLRIYERTPTGRMEVQSDLWYLLNEQPCANFTAVTMWEWVLKCQLLRGDGFVQIIRDRRGKPIQLVPLNPDRVKPELVGGRLFYAVLPVEGKAYGLDQDDMLHFPGFGFDGVSGMSVIKFAAFQSIGIALAADGFSGKFFANGATPKHLITSPKKLDEDQVDELRRTYSERYTGPENAGKPMVLTQGLDIKELSLSAADAELLETRKYQVIDICRGFGVPPFMVGAQETTTSFGSGIEHMTLGFTKFTCQPLLTRIQQEVNRKLFLTEKYFVEHDMDSLLRGDSKAEGEYLRQAIGGSQGPGWLTPNEVRRIKNMPPIDGGHVRYEPKSGTPNAQTPTPATP